MRAKKNRETAKHVEGNFALSDPNSLDQNAKTIYLRFPFGGNVSVPMPFSPLEANLPARDASLLQPAHRHWEASHSVGVTRGEALKRLRALFGSKEDALDRLYELAAECAAADWDGYDAEAVSQGAVERSALFIRRLPEDLPLPEISVEPDGEIALDWSPTPTQTFSVSIGTANRMACAWVNGTEHGHAVAYSNNGEIPSRILQEIQRITNNDSTFRTA